MFNFFFPFEAGIVQRRVPLQDFRCCCVQMNPILSQSMTFPAGYYLQPFGAGSAAGSPPTAGQAGKAAEPAPPNPRSRGELENVTYTWVIFNFLSFPYTVKLPPAYLSG